MGKKVWTRDPDDKTETPERRIDTLREAEESRGRNNWAVLTQMKDSYMSGETEVESVTSIPDDGHEPWEPSSREEIKKRLYAKLRWKQQVKRERRAYWDEKRAKCSELCKDTVGIHVLEGEERDKYIKEREWLKYFYIM